MTCHAIPPPCVARPLRRAPLKPQMPSSLQAMRSAGHCNTTNMIWVKPCNIYPGRTSSLFAAASNNNSIQPASMASLDGVYPEWTRELLDKHASSSRQQSRATSRVRRLRSEPLSDHSCFDPSPCLFVHCGALMLQHPPHTYWNLNAPGPRISTNKCKCWETSPNASLQRESSREGAWRRE